MTEFRKITDPGFIWGALFEPVRKKNVMKEGMRTVIFGSTTAGELVLRSLAALEEKHPERLNLIAMVTDDPLDPATQISVRKRIWNEYKPEEMQQLRDKVILTCMTVGITCYTGGIKTSVFHDIYRQWNPDLVIVCCFGQLIDHFLFNYPRCGMYNFHPSDLAANIGAGPKPFEHTISEGRTTSVMIIHRVNEKIDAGPIIGKSPPINICLENGQYPESLLTLQEKIPAICGWMSVELTETLNGMAAAGIHQPVERIDFDTLVPENIKQILMKPAVNDPGACYELPPHHLIC